MAAPGAGRGGDPHTSPQFTQPTKVGADREVLTLGLPALGLWHRMDFIRMARCRHMREMAPSRPPASRRRPPAPAAARAWATSE